MNSKGQIQQVFIYIMAIIVIGFLVLFAFKLIMGLLNTKCEIDETSFQNTLDQKISRSTRGTTNVKLETPCADYVLCFINASNLGDPLNATNRVKYPVISSSLDDNIPYNVYLIEFKTDGSTIPVLYDERIYTGTQEEIVCIEDERGIYSFWLQGLGQEGVYLYTE